MNPIRVLIILTLLATTAFALGQVWRSDSPGPIDHVRILVRDMADARADFHDRLGFDFRSGQAIMLPEGSAHDAMWLANRSYLELIAVADREKLMRERPWIVEFLDRHQGAHSIGLSIASAAEFSEKLRAHGIDAPVSTLLNRSGGAPFHNVTPKLPHLPEGVIFFTEYPSNKSSAKPEPPVHHANSARRILAVWILVNNLRGAIDDMRGLGFPEVRSVKSSALAAEGIEFGTQRGSIILLRPIGSGPASEFEKNRGAGVMGVTLQVEGLDAARSFVKRNDNRDSSTYQGFYGSSILVPSQLAEELWIEMTTLQ
jgi:catechol 2,3-dioxygenase-like lactoylglutathione lyase family enzyme